jgi:hypothetical protein
LADEGHVVGFLLQSNAKIPDVIRNSSVHVVQYRVNTGVPFMDTEEASQRFVESALAGSILQQFLIMIEVHQKKWPHWYAECDALLTDEGIQKHMAEVNYDIAIMDHACYKCHIALPYRLGIPFIFYGVLYSEWTFRDPTLSSFVPCMWSGLGDDMTFVERVQNTLFYIITHITLITSLNQDVLPNTDPPAYVLDVLTKGAFYFVLDDISIAYPRPLMPNIMYVGDIIPQPGVSLPHDIATFVDSAAHGVVIVSFGSVIDFLPQDIAAKFCSVFNRIPQKVIWKHKNKTLCDADPNKVLILDWLPQNDLLSHDNVKVFISHCGINSVLESIYHATPIIGFPVCYDQPYNANRVQNRGLGYRMKIHDFTEEQLHENIPDLLNNTVIQGNVIRASKIMRNKPDTPKKRVLYWVEHLVEHGTQHLRTNAFKLNMLQFYGLDVLLLLLCASLLTIVIVFTCLRWSFRHVRYNYLSSKTKFD